ncbi:hypothetical protein LNTAR_02629 [Lentisphaera araneosa HTCC2155]|uniref:Uncharacterized protein n=2 Tax=Lentisphaera TaxID=256846 RepID=A6DUE5_9BACT|nr:hypothetical protein LNTAR_02629 [Lentisphaera araneosa HTCC2155]
MQALSKPLSLAAILTGPALIAIYAMSANVSFLSADFVTPLSLVLINSVAVIIINEIFMTLMKDVTLGLGLKLAKSFLLIAILAIALFTQILTDPKFACFAFLIGYSSSMVFETISYKNNISKKVN